MNDDIKGLIMPLAIVVLLVIALVGGIIFLFTYDTDSGLDVEEEYKAEEDKDTTYTLDEDNNQITATNMKAIMKTTLGDIEIQLNGKDAPKTVANFVKLAESGFYDETKFHRVIKGFMIQGGDPLSKNDSDKNQWGTGGPGYQFEDEIHINNNNIIGTIAMANSGPNTNGSQFFINTVDNDFLDPKHTVFGKVISGIDIVQKIENAEVNGSDQPIVPVTIESIQIIEK